MNYNSWHTTSAWKSCPKTSKKPRPDRDQTALGPEILRTGKDRNHGPVFGPPPRLETPSLSPFVHVLALPEASDNTHTSHVDENTELPSESPFVHVSLLADTTVEPIPQDGHENGNNTGDAMETEADNWEITANLADWGILRRWRSYLFFVSNRSATGNTVSLPT